MCVWGWQVPSGSLLIVSIYFEDSCFNLKFVFSRRLILEKDAPNYFQFYILLSNLRNPGLSAELHSCQCAGMLKG